MEIFKAHNEPSVTRITILALAALAIASAEPRTPVIVELFTSEGCSSCPPADEVLTRLGRDQPIPGVEVIPLSEHVTYWNSSAWHDPFSAMAFSWRQYGYRTLFHLDSPYTPELVVNGQAELVGSDWDAAMKAIRAAAQAPKIAMTLSLKSGDVLSAQIGQLARGADAANIKLAITESNLESSVSGGENGGHRLRHTGVVRSLSTIGHLDAKRPTYSGDTRLKLDPKWNQANLKIVVFVEEQDTRHVLGAAALHP
jgi:hypothetical protein